MPYIKKHLENKILKHTFVTVCSLHSRLSPNDCQIHLLLFLPIRFIFCRTCTICCHNPHTCISLTQPLFPPRLSSLHSAFQQHKIPAGHAAAPVRSGCAAALTPDYATSLPAFLQSSRARLCSAPAPPSLTCRPSQLYPSAQPLPSLCRTLRLLPPFR